MKLIIYSILGTFLLLGCNSSQVCTTEENLNCRNGNELLLPDWVLDDPRMRENFSRFVSGIHDGNSKVCAEFLEDSLFTYNLKSKIVATECGIEFFNMEMDSYKDENQIIDELLKDHNFDLLSHWRNSKVVYKAFFESDYFRNRIFLHNNICLNFGDKINYKGDEDLNNYKNCLVDIFNSLSDSTNCSIQWNYNRLMLDSYCEH